MSEPPSGTATSAESAASFMLGPYAWAERVLTHMNSEGQLKVFPLKVDFVRDAAVALTNATRIRYRPMVSPTPKKLVGRFTRTHVQIEGDIKPLIEVLIDFDQTMDEHHRRLVICKEVCHAFYSDVPDTRTVTVEDLDVLMEGLAAMNLVRKNGERLEPHSPALSAERLAMQTAVEILLPLEVREEILAYHQGDYDAVPLARLANDFLLPQPIMKQIFSPGFHDNAKMAMRRIGGL